MTDMKPRVCSDDEGFAEGPEEDVLRGRGDCRNGNLKKVVRKLKDGVTEFCPEGDERAVCGVSGWFSCGWEGCRGWGAKKQYR